MNLKAIMSAIALVPSIVPLINSTVQEVESLFGSLPGQQKLAAATAKVEALIDAVVADLAVVTRLKAIVEPLINAAVAMFNEAKTGAFGDKPAALPGEAATSADVSTVVNS